MRSFCALAVLTQAVVNVLADDGARVPLASPYPPSTVVRNFQVVGERLSIGRGDNWAITWGREGRQFSFLTDGRGFGLHSEDVSTAPVIIEGEPPSIRGFDIDSPSGTVPDPASGRHAAKVCGLLAVDDGLYAWVRNLNLPATPEGTGSTLIYSFDNGQTWECVDWVWKTIGYPVWMNAGQNYEASEDRFVYFVSPDGPSAYADYPDLILGRASIDELLSKESYTFFSGLDARQQPTWGEYANRRPILTDEAGVFRPELVYNPGLKRYLLTSCSPYGEWEWWANQNAERRPHFAVFDAPKPWGPWTTVHYEADWGAPENRFSPRIPSKWISDDGRSFYLLYSCIPNGPYRFNVQRCTVDVE